MHNNFRHDIAAMRAIAVISVVLYHFKVPGFGGGFVGVDVFFVLSGYLMSSLYSDKIINSRDGTLSFYASRIRRLYPALIMLCVISVVFLYASSPAYMVDDIIKESRYALSFLSNFFYSNSSGYFDDSSSKRWLLHTWSLSVEFQFYLIFPIIVIASKVFRGINKQIYSYSVLFIFSFSYCMWFTYAKEESSFYITFARVWELLAGSIASLVSFSAPRLFRRVFCYFGVFVVLMCVTTYKERTLWPDAMSILPIFGAVICLVCCNDKQFSFIRSRVVVFISEVSYSLYLWHWVIVAYMNNSDIEFTTSNIIKAISMSVFMAVISRKFFENFGNSWIRYSSLVLTFFICATYFLSNSISSSLEKITKYSNFGASPELSIQFHSKCFIQSDKFDLKSLKSNGCLESSPEKKTILLVGDSHAAQLSGALRVLADNYNIVQITASGCYPSPDNGNKNGCQKLFNFLYGDYLKKNNVDYVILASYWISYGKDNLESRIMSTLTPLLSNTKNVFVVSEMKTFPEQFYKIAMSYKPDDLCRFQRKDSRGFSDLIGSYIRESGARYVDVYDFEEDSGRCGLIKDGIPMYFDKNHLTPKGSEMVVKALLKEMNL